MHESIRRCWRRVELLEPGPTEGLFYRKLEAKRPTWADRRPVLQEAPSETPNLGRQKACFNKKPQAKRLLFIGLQPQGMERLAGGSLAGFKVKGFFH